ncbi:hypothetical protein PMAYCL1PPCAC_32477 [Pristionchus mayeri]|uniref:Uncharacterized protein n=1 Tax=Pristionchus mayeri TaxID=1317129 RepID=A0AAN5DGV6_9BILA|nr:hypothetical protein PMAYCL1PPCAC_32477 [Pristionchus mayeri]
MRIFLLCLIAPALFAVSTASKCYLEYEINGKALFPRVERTCLNATANCYLFTGVISKGDKWDGKDCDDFGNCLKLGMGCHQIVGGGEICCCQGDLCNKERPPVILTSIDRLDYDWVLALLAVSVALIVVSCCVRCVFCYRNQAFPSDTKARLPY